MNFIKYYFLGAIIVFATIFGMATYIQPLIGDLTRVSNVSEKDWGWNRPQPPISVQSTETNEDPEILVIGDSFSEKNIWQSELNRLSGLIIKSYRWEDFGHPSCIEQGIKNLKEKYPSIVKVLVQTVERESTPRFIALEVKNQACPDNFESSIHTNAYQTAKLRPKILTEIPDLVYTLKSLIALTKKYTQTVISGDGYISPLNKDDLFSNRNSNALLYYAVDMEKIKWTKLQYDQSVKNIKNLDENFKKQNLQLIIVVVPDKSTVYNQFLTKNPFKNIDSNIWDELKGSSIKYIDLNKTFKLNVQHIKDFYLPNDTHLGGNGYIHLANEVFNYINSIKCERACS